VNGGSLRWRSLFLGSFIRSSTFFFILFTLLNFILCLEALEAGNDARVDIKISLVNRKVDFLF
jgi:hypothetical protein